MARWAVAGGRGRAVAGAGGGGRGANEGKGADVREDAASATMWRLPVRRSLGLHGATHVHPPVTDRLWPL